MQKAITGYIIRAVEVFLSGFTVLLVLAISTVKSDTRDLVTRVSKSFSLVRRVRGRVSSSSKSGYVNSHSFRSKLSQTSNFFSRYKQFQINQKSDGSRVQMRNFSENRKLRDKLRQKDVRNIRPTETTSSHTISTSALTTPGPFSTSTSLTSITSPMSERRLQSKYKSAEANYLALRREAVNMNQELD